MSSSRTSIRTAAATAIVSTGVVGARVTQGRGHTLDGSTFPCIYIYAIDEQIETQTLAPRARTQWRQLAVVVDYYQSQDDSTVLEDLLDAASATIEDALVADVTLGGACRDLTLTRVEYIEESDENRRWGLARHTFNAIYTTSE